MHTMRAVHTEVQCRGLEGGSAAAVGLESRSRLPAAARTCHPALRQPAQSAINTLPLPAHAAPCSPAPTCGIMRHMHASVAGHSADDSCAGSVRRTAATRAAASHPHAATWLLMGRCFSRCTREGMSTAAAAAPPEGRPPSRALAAGAEAARPGLGRGAACTCCCWRCCGLAAAAAADDVEAGPAAPCCASGLEPSEMVPRERAGEAGRCRSSPPLDTADRASVSGVAAPELDCCDSAAVCRAVTSVGEPDSAAASSSCAGVGLAGRGTGAGAELPAWAAGSARRSLQATRAVGAAGQGTWSGAPSREGRLGRGHCRAARRSLLTLACDCWPPMQPLQLAWGLQRRQHSGGRARWVQRAPGAAGSSWQRC